MNWIKYEPAVFFFLVDVYKDNQKLRLLCGCVKYMLVSVPDKSEVSVVC
jgi:hypothetical protein